MQSRSMLRQSLPLLILLGIAEAGAGGVLGGFIETFNQIDGLILLIPALIALRGYIGGAMASRLGSAIHLGLISSENVMGRIARMNIKANIVLSFMLTIVSLGYAFTLSMVLNREVDLLLLGAVVMTAALASALLLSLLTLLIIKVSFMRELDPDNITSPMVATLGDAVTLGCLVLAAGTMGGLL